MSWDCPVKLFRKSILLLFVAALATSACASADDTSVESAAPSPSDESVAADSSQLECELKGYPCTLGEVPFEILKRTDSLGNEAVSRFEAGESTEDVASWLQSQEGMAELQFDDEGIFFRLDGGRRSWLLTADALRTRSSPGQPGTQIDSPSSALTNVVRPGVSDKRALILSPFAWEFEPLDEGNELEELLQNTRGYEGGVKYEANANMEDQTVDVEDFIGWEDFDIVHLATHGFQICYFEEEICEGVVSTGRSSVVYEDDDILSYKDLGKIFNAIGVDIGKVEGGRRGLELTGPPTLWFVGADFFRSHYPNGLGDTLVFFNGCNQNTGPPPETPFDLSELLRGSTSAYLGWDLTVLSRAAEPAAMQFYRDLSEFGYPISVAYERLGSVATDPWTLARLHLSPRSDGEDMHIREIVTLLHPDSHEPIGPGDTVRPRDSDGDGVGEVVPYVILVEGIVEESAADVTVVVSVNGQETEPIPLTTGVRDSFDRWLIAGALTLEGGIPRDTPITIQAVATLPGGGTSQHTIDAAMGDPLITIEIGPATDAVYGAIVGGSATSVEILGHTAFTIRVSPSSERCRLQTGVAFASNAADCTFTIREGPPFLVDKTLWRDETTNGTVFYRWVGPEDVDAMNFFIGVSLNRCRDQSWYFRIFETGVMIGYPDGLVDLQGISRDSEDCLLLSNSNTTEYTTDP